MSYQPLSISEFSDGLVTDREPYIIEDDANPVLTNAYQWRKRLFKKGGQIPFGQLGLKIETVPAGGAGILTSTPITPGKAVFYSFGHVAHVDTPFSAVIGTWLDYPGSTINYTTGAYAGLAAGDMWYYTNPTDLSPCMGILIQEKRDVNNENAMAFDRTTSYLNNGNTTDWLPLPQYLGGNPLIWTGSDTDFFNGCNYFSSLWATNGLPGYHASRVATSNGDGIRYFFGSWGPVNGWVNFNPPIDIIGNFLQGSKFILPFKGRLLVFNTYEGPNFAGVINYQNRIRWCQDGTPYYAAGNLPPNTAFDVDSWQTQQGKGGFEDLPTQEAITGVAYLKDTLLIYCERSTYLLLSTGDKFDPFEVQKHNADFGCESPKSIIQFDEEAFCVGNNGIFHASMSGVDRIDRKIPDVVFTIKNSDGGIDRVCGARSYFPEMAIWAYRDGTDEGSVPRRFPNKELIYNYVEDSWAQFINSYTAFCNYQNDKVAQWVNTVYPWSSTGFAWNSADTLRLQPMILAGNQQGYMFLLREMGDSSQMRNAPSLQITGISPANPSVFTVPNHNLQDGQYIQITGVLGALPATALNGNIYVVQPTSLTDNTFTLKNALGNNVTVIANYYGNGEISLIDQIEIQTKRFNPLLEEGKSCRFGYGDFLAYISPTQKIEVDAYVDYRDTYQSDPTNFISYTLSGDAESIQRWYRIYPQVVGQFITFVLKHPIRFLFQTTNGIPDSASQFILTGLQLWFAPSGRLVR